MFQKLKKILLPALLCLGLLLCMPLAAHADEYCNLGTYTAGEEINCFIAAVEGDMEYTAEGLPAGCRLECVQMAEGSFLNLVGTPAETGVFDFTVDAPAPIVCTITITPAVPQISVTADQTVRPGATLTLTAQAAAADGGTLSYQWYSGGGLMAAPVEGATEPSLTVTFNEPGDYFYACRVTNSGGGQSVSDLSDQIVIRVIEPVAIGVKVETMPAKTSYKEGEDFDMTGLTLRLSYDDGSEKVVSDGFSAFPDRFNEAGTQSVRITYGELHCSLTVKVTKEKAEVIRIELLKAPDKTDYKVGDSLDTRGLTVRVYTDDGEYQDVTAGFDCSPLVFDTDGGQTVTVKYENKTCSFPVTVEKDKVITGISVLTPPTLTTYKVGERIDTKGLSIRVNTTKGPEPVTEGYTITPKVVTTVGTQTITVLYGQYSATFDVTVTEATPVTATPKPTPTPRPTASPDPANPSPAPTAAASASPRVTPAPTTRRGPGAGITVALIIAVLALAGLAGYVWYMRSVGFSDEGPVGIRPVEPEEEPEDLTPPAAPAPETAETETPGRETEE